jgi:t-SNARE complex subunit (syntaxin)
MRIIDDDDVQEIERQLLVMGFRSGQAKTLANMQADILRIQAVIATLPALFAAALPREYRQTQEPPPPPPERR